MLIYRMEDAEGRGPFDGSETDGPRLSPEDWNGLIATVSTSVSIFETLMPWAHLRADMARARLRRRLGQEPVFGAPDLECFERWFPLKFRRLYAAKGFRPVAYEVPADAVAMGGSEAECVFVRHGSGQVLDPETLEPLESALSGAGADWQ